MNQGAPEAAPSENEVERELEHYRIYSRNEIMRILREMARAGEMVTATFADGKSSVLTSIVGIDSGERRLVFDWGPHEVLNQRLLQAGGATLIGRHQHVRVQFKVQRIERVALKDGLAFAAPLPEWIARFQRREFYRLVAPSATPLFCYIPRREGTPLTARVLDLSLGGLGMLESSAITEEGWEIGSVIKTARVDIPGHGVVVSDLEVRNRLPVMMGGGGEQFRIGCRFLQLTPRMSAEIQRYIHRVELERRRVGQD